MMATGKKVVQVYILYKTTATKVQRLSYQNIDNACSLFLPTTTRLYTGRGTNHNKHLRICLCLVRYPYINWLRVIKGCDMKSAHMV